MTDDEREKQELVAEQSRRSVAAIVSATALALGAVVLTVLSTQHEFSQSVAVLQPTVAFLLATSITTGSRALEGPVSITERRKSDERKTGAMPLVKVWLGCFALIWLSLTASQLLGSLPAALRTSTEIKVVAGTSVDVRGVPGQSQAQISVPAGGAPATLTVHTGE
jgi:hypothetical protein